MHDARTLAVSLALGAGLLTGCANGAAQEGPGARSAADAVAADDGPTLTPLPKTERRVVTETLHGTAVEDPYRWLEDVEAPEVQAWMKARDAQARAYLGALPGRDALRDRYRALLYVEERSAPMKKGDRLFFAIKAADREKAVWYVQPEGGERRVLIDPNTLSDDGSISVHGVVPTPQGDKVAYMEQANNADESTLRVMDVATGELLAADSIPHLRYTRPSWTPKGDGFYYTWIPHDPKIPTNERMGYGEVRFHRLGTDPAKDRVVRGKTGDASRWQSAGLSDDGRWLVLGISRGWSEEDVYVMDVTKKGATWQPLAVGTKSNYMVEHHDGAFYVATNHEAPRFQIYRVDPKRMARKDWTRIVPEHDTAVLQSMHVVGGKLGLAYLDKATSRLEVRDLKGDKVRDVALPGLGSASGFYGEADQDTAYFVFSSFTYPNEIYATKISSGETTRFARADVPVQSDDFEVEQVSYPSKDGTQISMFLVHKKGALPKDGSNRVLMFGYGGFNISLAPEFKALYIPWLESGGVYAMPNLRGGGEYGEAWHKGGMLQNKQNVFDDFIGAAAWLQAEGYTTPERTVIYGRSNGGLLVGAAMTQAPERYTAVVCGVPLLDMVRYHMFGVGRAWIPEYGSSEAADQFAWLYAYSPYHRVKAGTDYPDLLMLSADTDDRVDPLHARKFVAAIEHARSDDDLTLLRIEANSGHGGADMRAAYAERMADMMAYVMSQAPAAGGE